MKRLIIFTDIGDTIIDEGTETRLIPEGVVQTADCIPGAKETMLKLYGMGFTIAMVADGLKESFQRTMSQNGLSHVFSAFSISECLGTHKPDEKMFRHAMNELGLSDEDKPRIIMVGNNLSRDILGANRFGIRSVLLDWTPRYPSETDDPEAQPLFVIHTPEELLPLAERLEALLQA